MVTHISPATAFISLPAFQEDGKTLNVFIDTPKNSRNKYKYDEKQGIFMLKKQLPAGSVFPYNFGYIPSTRGGDGDPLDVLVIMDEEVFTSCLVPSRLIGVIEAEQTEEGKTVKNSRLIAVATASLNHSHIHKLDDLNQHLVEEIEHFFIAYNRMEGKEFKPTGRKDGEVARQLVHQGEQNFKQSDH